MNRGDVVVAVLPGDTGKPRPAIVLRADRFAAHHRVVVIPITSELHDPSVLRLDLAPSSHNGLRGASQAMIDRLTDISAQRVGSVIGQLDPVDIRAIDAAVLVYLGFAG